MATATSQTGTSATCELSLVLPPPLGPLELVVAEDGLHGIHFLPSDWTPGAALAGEAGSQSTYFVAVGRPAPKLSARQLRVAELTRLYLEAYVAGRHARRPPLKLQGSEFQRAVWSALMDVPKGRTVSYGALAQLAGRDGAARAVGGAMARNPCPVVVPCHRVLQSGGKLGGFTGGLYRKRALLAHEGFALREE